MDLILKMGKIRKFLGKRVHRMCGNSCLDMIAFKPFNAGLAFIFFIIYLFLSNLLFISLININSHNKGRLILSLNRA